MKYDAKSLEQELLSFIPEGDEYIGTLVSSMKYSLTAGGKRVRPMLVFAFTELCGGKVQAAIPFACALEMIHTYSLIHDDLPCMDNDDLRRGKPTNHKVYGEAAALLAGNGLFTLAYEVVLSERAVKLNGWETCAKIGRLFAECSGVCGMLGGQIIDLESENKRIDESRLRVMDEKKTGALIRAACLAGCICAGADEAQMKAAAVYAENIGLVFQIVDDILDVTSDTATLGKPVGSDLENSKSTYVSLLGLENCRALCYELTEKAVSALSGFPGDTSRLCEFALMLRDRMN